MEIKMKVFICFTPLHVLISKRIIEEEGIVKYLFVYFTDSDTEKNKYYYKKLANNSVESFYIVLKKKFIYDLKIIYKLSKKVKKHNELIYYSGKIKSSHNRLLMYLTTYNKLITFDDGSGNISGDGYFYDINEGKFFQLFFMLFNKKLLYKNIKESRQLHYTIFDLPNVFSNTKKIQLFKTKMIQDSSLPNLVILLTNAFAEDGEMELEKEKEAYRQIISKYNVTKIIRHPREKYIKITDKKVEEIKDLRIAEEVIIDLANKYNITLIGMYSTVLLNFLGTNIKLINCDVKVKKPVSLLFNILNKDNS
jgi:hypothetical protein